MDPVVKAGERLADAAAVAVAEPRRFLENASAQHALGSAIAEFRLAVRKPVAEFEPETFGEFVDRQAGISRDIADLLAGLEVSSIKELADHVDLARQTVAALNRVAPPGIPR